MLNNIQTIIDNTHITWLSKAKTAVINGEEMTVLPYGYLSTATKDSLTSMLDGIEKGAVAIKADIEFMKKSFPHQDSIDKLESYNNGVQEVINIINSHR